MNKECLIVVASYADGWLDRFLTSVEKYTTDVDYDIIVVDNSRDKKLQKEVVIDICKKHKVQLHTDENITGFSHALITGVEKYKGDSKYILYIHTDIEVTKGWLKEMINCYERHKSEGCRLVGCLVKNFDGKWENPDGCHDRNDYLCTGENYLKGCFLREINTLNKFNWDKNFLRVYSDDIDICTQVRYWKYQCWTAGKVLIYHGKNTSHKAIKKEGKHPYAIGARNKTYLQDKWKNVAKYNKIFNNQIRNMTLGTAFLVVPLYKKEKI